MFAGFRSRWMIPCSCAASSASAICFAMGKASDERYRSTRDVRGQILALDKLHDQCADVTGLLEPVDSRDVRVVQRGQGLGFALEPREAIRVGGERHGENLDRNVAPQLGIARAIDLAHAAGAEGGKASYGPSRVPDCNVTDGVGIIPVRFQTLAGFVAVLS